MKHLPLILILASACAMGTAQAGAPKPEHPCYGVADCKTKDSRDAFSEGIKANKEEADANPACAAFRKDKDSWLQENGLPGVDSLFES